jgi:homoserine kinase
MSLPVRVRAPATTANLGPGFDCAGAALELWNELEVTDGEGVEVLGEGAGEISPGADHLGLRAFALLAPLAGKRFVFTNRIPLARGLGSSGATIACGLVAASLALGRERETEQLLGLGLRLEPHADNLAPALAGGVCLTWASGGRQRVARVADSLPLAPIAVVPEARVETAAARAALPREVSHADAAFTVARAALLGAALAGGEPGLLADAFDDRLHEPYRGPLSPVYGPIREQLPAGAAGLTISGSGPTVIVWARPGEAAGCARELEARFPAARVLSLSVAATGAGPAP